MKLRILVLAGLLAGCAAQQQVALMPRGEGHESGAGYFDQIHQQLAVDIEGQRYVGTPITKTASTGFSLFGPQATTSTNEQSALLTGNGGQVRCEFAWNQFKTMANGVCVDSRNVTYDMMIRNP